ncbi:MAG: hypothetical protein EBR40_11640, partial [Proteobacteria bacterium]|nr:hypothetical protein [Pseudomonadota bacterium]
MSAGEIKSRYQPNEGDFDDVYQESTNTTRPESKREFWGRKLQESKLTRAEYDALNEHGDAEEIRVPELDLDKALERSDYPYQRTGESTSSYERRDESWWEDRMASHDAKV